MLNALGLDIGAVRGPFMNSSGHYAVFYEDPTVSGGAIQPGAGALGFSYGAGGAGTVEVRQKSTAVVAEAQGAITALLVSGTLGNTYVLPGTVVLNNSGGTGPVVVDNGQGKLVLQGTTQQVGVINYATGVFSFAYRATAAGTGNLTANYEHSDLPDSADVPGSAYLRSISLLSAAATVNVSVYSDAALTVPDFIGTVPVTAGQGFLNLGGVPSNITDLTTRDRRWIVVSAAVTDLRLHWERATG